MKNSKRIRAIINAAVFIIVAAVFLIIQQKMELDYKYDMIIGIFITLIYEIITLPINCFIEKSRKRSKR